MNVIQEKMLENVKLELIMKQWAAIEICVHLGKLAMQTNDLIRHIFCMEAMTWSKVIKWCKAFYDGQTMIEHAEGSGCP